MRLVNISKRLRRLVSQLRFESPVTHVYNPLEYAWKPHARYLRCFGTGRKEFVLLGMNPGPWGMAQTGVPFGEVAAVREWMGIEEAVGRPAHEHPKRSVEGFACQRSEVSGRRLWGWAAERFGSAEQFFARFYVHNYCPLAFLEESGRNRTPDKLPAREKEPLFAICDQALRDVIEALAPKHVIGIGAFAEKQAQRALTGFGVDIARMPHPSPASPAANRGWAESADRAFAKIRR